MDRKPIIKADIKVTQDVDQWNVESVFVNINNDLIHPIYSGEQFKTKDAAITEMKHRAMKYLKEKGRTETESQIEWNISR
jgi:hypothetical protein